MQNTKVYHLNKGTVLDDRYEIGSVLGEGGFGITYGGKNIRSGDAVAIKEFFCVDYMARAEDGVTAVLVNKDMRRRFNTERGRFMREARILGEFKDEPGVVTVRDYFEANGTAYLVMEFIDGDTLRDYVKKNGALKPADFFEEIRPLMTTLSKIHDAGVIHRDISPDNIMRTSDGSLMLIDFGSAKDLSGRTVTTATTYKDGFAPPEQYTQGKKQGPRTDIYSLAATFYYCLTGQRPESAIQRVMVDELRPLRELRGDLPEDIEQMISKGMALRPEDRFGSIGEMEEIIEARYPLLSPEEKARAKKRKRLKWAAVAAAAVVLIALAGIHVFRNSTAYRMRMQETVVAYLSWDEPQNDREAANVEASKEIVHKRLEVFAGKNNYLWDDGDVTRIEIPAKLVGDNDPADLLRKYITRRIDSFILTHADENMEPQTSAKVDGEWVPLMLSYFEKSDIVSVETGEGNVPTGESTEALLPYVKVKLAPDDASKNEFLLTRGLRMTFVLRADNDPYTIPCFAEGDGETIYVIPQEAVDAGEFKKAVQDAVYGRSSEVTDARGDNAESFLAVLAYDLESEGAKTPPGVEAEPSVEWETPDNMLAGANQVSAGEIKGKSFVIEYSNENANIGKSEWLNVTSALRTRLDALDIPYAFGVSRFDDRVAYIKVREGDISQAEILMAGIRPYLSISNIVGENTVPHGRLVMTGGDGGRSVELVSDTIFGIMEDEHINKSRQKGEDIIVGLGMSGEYPVGLIRVQDITEEGLRNGRLPLAEFGIGAKNAPAEDQDRLLKYLDAVLSEATATAVYPSRVCLYDRKGKYLETLDLADVEGSFYPDEIELARKVDSDIKAEIGDNFGALSYVDGGKYSILLLDGSASRANIVDDAVKKAEKYLQKYGFEERGIDMEIRISNNLESGADPGVPNVMVTLRFRKMGYYADDKAGKYALVYVYVDALTAGVEDDALEEQLYEEVMKAAEESELLSRLISNRSY